MILNGLLDLRAEKGKFSLLSPGEAAAAADLSPRRFPFVALLRNAADRLSASVHLRQQPNVAPGPFAVVQLRSSASFSIRLPPSVVPPSRHRRNCSPPRRSFCCSILSTVAAV
ncbi:unnamed protein product [Citrullus colocynthis]|uniref:Uncharacterized protein n=1 Tax=Citrullus colocynthis TaxID=252529 RepID=A0ABP0Y9K9_9ROSI